MTKIIIEEYQLEDISAKFDTLISQISGIIQNLSGLPNQSNDPSNTMGIIVGMAFILEEYTKILVERLNDITSNAQRIDEE